MVRALSLPALLAATLVAPAPALAWDHLGWALAPEDLPLRVSVEAGFQVDGMTRDQALADIEAGLERWDEASCGLSVEFVGEVAYDDPTDVPQGELHLTFADLGDDAQRFIRLGPSPELPDLYERGGRTYLRAQPGAWVVNTSGGFASEAVILDGSCQGAFPLSSTVGTLLGVNAGLALSNTPGSLMSPFPPTCTIVRPSDDDLEGIHALYGPWVDFACASDVSGAEGEVPGVVPFDVTCEVLPDPSSVLTSATWTFGDGTDGEGSPVTHRYTEDDNYTVRVRAEVEHATCGPASVRLERANYIRACGAPQPDLRVERSRGLLFRLVNASDVRTYGCHNQVSWEVFDEDGARVLSASAWEPLVELPDEGVYRAVLTLGGPAGSETAEQVFDTRDGSVRGYTLGSGCSGVGLGGLGPIGGLGLLGLLGLRRRRLTSRARPRE